MNKEQLQQKIAFYFEKLPPGAQVVFSKMEWLEKLQFLGKVYALSPEQMETLGTETTLVLLGIINSVEYEKNLSEELHLPRLTLDKIVNEINSSVLNSIRNELDNAYNTNITANTPEEVAVGSKLDERFAGLPKDIQDSISNSNYYASLYTIVTENNLTIPQMGALEECLSDAMLGKIATSELKDAILRRVGVSAEVADKLIKEINEKISKELREKLMLEAMPRQTEDHKILESAGIEIIGEGAPKIPKTPEEPKVPPIIIPKPESPKPAPVIESKADIPDLSVPELPAPVLSQKFAGSFKMDTVKTEISVTPQKKVEEKPKNYPKGVDPYREMPQ